MNQNNPFAFDFSQNQQGQQGNQLGGLAALVGQLGNMQGGETANTFSSETPGAPSQPGRVDQTSFAPPAQSGGQDSMPGDGIASMAGMNPFWLLSSLIAKKFGS